MANIHDLTVCYEGIMKEKALLFVMKEKALLSVPSSILTSCTLVKLNLYWMGVPQYVCQSAHNWSIM